MRNFSEKLSKWNFKKIAVSFVAVAAAVGIAGAAILYSNFGSRVEQWRTQAWEYRQSITAQYQQNGGTQENWRDSEYAMHPYRRTRCGDAGYRGNGRYGRHIRGERMGMVREFADQLGLSTGDKVLLAATGASMALLALTARILLALWIAQKAIKSGTNPVLWGLLTAVFHLFAVVVFFIYRSLRHQCPNCHRIQNQNAEFCSDCGTALMKTCEGCGSKNDKKATFCNHCGQRME